MWVTEGKLPERVKGQVSFDDFVQLIATYCLFNREDMLMCTCRCCVNPWCCWRTPAHMHGTMHGVLRGHHSLFSSL